MKPDVMRQTARKGLLHGKPSGAPWRNPSVLRFAKNEDGTLLVLGMMLFLLMAMMGGLAIDLMRYEQRRTEMQQTLDRSVLAGAAMNQAAGGEQVVADWSAPIGWSSLNVSAWWASGLSESPRVYWRVKLSKDEPHGTEKISPEVHG